MTKYFTYWNKIIDNLPNKNGNYLCFTANKELANYWYKNIPYILEFKNGVFDTSVLESIDSKTKCFLPTHWMELPKPPEN